MTVYSLCYIALLLHVKPCQNYEDKAKQNGHMLPKALYVRFTKFICMFLRYAALLVIE